MPLGAFRINAISKIVVTAVAEVIRSKKGIITGGNAQISTTQSKFGGSSALFDGNGDYLQIQDSLDFNFAGNNFTIEFWLYESVFGVIRQVIGKHSTIGGNSTSSWLVLSDSGKIQLSVFSGDTIYTITEATQHETNTWIHYACVRNGSSTVIYKNGTSVASSTTLGSNELNTTNRKITIGIVASNDLPDQGNYALNGRLDEIRVSNTARYTANFTAPTQPFVNDDNTRLLIHADGTNASTFFEDDNGVRQSHTLINGSNVSISTAQSKFGGSSITVGSEAIATVFSGPNPGSGNFTIEFWLYLSTNTAATQGIITKRDFSNIGSGTWGIRVNGSTNIISWEDLNQLPVVVLNSTSGFSDTTWTHFAFVRNGSTLTIYRNGTSVGSGTFSTNYTTGQPLRFFDWDSGGGNSLSSGSYLDEVRISNIARYTANFIAPTEPFVNDTNTLLLLHGDGTNGSTHFRDDNGVLANRQPKYIAAFGNAQVSTAQSQFGGASALFDGNGDWLQMDASPDFAFGTGDFTLEAWIRIAADSTANNGGTRYASIMSNAPAGTPVDIYEWALIGNTTTTGTGLSLVAYIGTGYGDFTSSFAFNKNQWYHVAAVRNAGTLTFYVDGTSIGSGTFTRTLSSPNPMRIGGQASTGFRHELNGFIDELRMSNTARYTANFTPSTTPFVNDANTRLLIHANGSNASTAFFDDTGSRSQKGVVAIGNIQISTAQSQFGGSSALLDGTNDHLKVIQDLFGDFTCECWIRLANVSGEKQIFRIHNSSDSFQYVMGVINSSLYVFSGGTTQGGTLLANTWYHIAFSRQGSDLRFYINGTQVGNRNVNTNLLNAIIYIGGDNTSAGMNGHIDELRISKTALYTNISPATFTAPTQPFVNDADTLLLLHMDGTNASTVFFDDNGVAPYTPT